MTDTATALPSIAGMLRGYSIEVSPGDAKIIEAASRRLDAGTEVSLTWVPGADPAAMVTSAAKLRRAGLFPVPHIAARHLESAAQLEQLAARLAGEAGVDRILVVGGDRSRPAGPYDCSLAVMQSGAFQNAGIVRMAVAGFPEGNPNLPNAELDRALETKIEFARGTGLQLSIVTQFAFKAEPIVEWLRRLRARGVAVPVRIGLAGPAGMMTLTHYAVRCGIGNSLRVLTENPSFARLLADKGPEPIIRGVVQGISSAEELRRKDQLPLGIAGLHFFVFDGFNKTIDWINAQLAH